MWPRIKSDTCVSGTYNNSKRCSLLRHSPLRPAGLVDFEGGGRSGPGVVVPWVLLFTFTLCTLIRYVDVLLCAWNTLVDMAKYQKTAKNTAILRHINATANVALWRNRDVIFARRCLRYVRI